MISPVAELERENQKLRDRIKKAQPIIEVQKKLLMGIPPIDPETGASNS
ncbi:hypothetical protein [Thermodesulfomicrobium sp. WS]|nr:hypothetical protein [Thermodesulfomicrobium sp. WS]